jgi:Secretion system C-terminal sorting domain
MKKVYRTFLYIIIILAGQKLLANDLGISNQHGVNQSLIQTAVVDSSYTSGLNLLNQNYPNPFNPTTTISFKLPEKSYVELNIYNILGVKLETLIKGVKNAGNYSVQFNASKYPSGIYFYELQTSNYKQIKKMIYMK